MDELAWRDTVGSAEPPEIDTVSSPTTVYLARNIVKQDGNSWKYESAKLTREEWKYFAPVYRLEREVDAALCELDTTTDSRMADIEQALCELDGGSNE